MKIKEEIIKILAAANLDGNKLFLTAQLDRKMYQDVNKTLVALGGKWNSCVKAHVFKSDIEDILQEIILTGEYTDEKKEFQFFPTPLNLAQKIVFMAKIQPNEQCLEPSAGLGNIAQFLPNCDCIELLPVNREHLLKNGFNLIHDDFMTFKPEKEYNVIVMNPPFAKQQDIAHVTKAINIAKRCVIAITGAGVLFRTDKKSIEFRELVKSHGGTIAELPSNSFKESGTMTNTALVIINKS